MLDRELLSRVRETLGMPKQAVAIDVMPWLAQKAAPIAAKAGPSLLSRAGGGIARLLKLLGISAAAGAGGYGAYRGAQALHASDRVRKLVENMSQPIPEATPEFDPSEQRMFARYGIDPERMKFLQTLSGWRSGMDLERSMLADALKGKLPASSAGAANDLASYA